MAEDKESTSTSLSQGLTRHDSDPDDIPKSPPSSPNSSTRKVKFVFALESLLWLNKSLRLIDLCFDWSGLLCCSSELGFEEVHDWMVMSLESFSSSFFFFAFLFLFYQIYFPFGITWLEMVKLQCGSLSSCCYLFSYLVVYPICWWFLQPTLCSTWHWHIW